MKNYYTIFRSVVLLAIFSLNTSNTNKAIAQPPQCLWANAFGADAFENDISWGIAVDAAGNVYTTGYFNATVDFDPGPGTKNLTSNGLNDIFVSKMDPSGNLIWAISMGADKFEYGYSIAVDVANTGDIYVTGSISSDSMDFDPGPDTAYITSTGYEDIFVARYDSAGNFVWAKSMGNAQLQDGRCIAVDPANGDVYISGGFYNSVDFDPGPGVYTLTSAGNDDGYVLKLNSAGNLIWAKSFSGNNDNNCPGLTIEPGSAHIYITGGFSSTVDFDPDSGVHNVTTSGFIDIFIAKLDSAGGLVWVKAMGGSDNDFGFGIDATNTDVFVTGFFQNTVDFDPGAGVASITSAGNFDGYVSKLDSGGNYVWTKQVGGTSLDRGQDLFVDPNGDVFTSGQFSDVVDFDPGSGTNNLTANGASTDIYVLKLTGAGDLAWAWSAGGGGNEGGNHMAFDASGSMYLTGHFYSQTMSFDGIMLTNVQTIGIGTYTDFYIAKFDTAFFTGDAPVNASAENIVVFPNPFTNEISVLTDLHTSDPMMVSVRNVLGEEIVNVSVDRDMYKLQLGFLRSGVYVLEINSIVGRIVRKVVKE